jgi:N-acetylmuramoyl-L-alanine amidase
MRAVKRRSRFSVPMITSRAFFAHVQEKKLIYCTDRAESLREVDSMRVWRISRFSLVVWSGILAGAALTGGIYLRAQPTQAVISHVAVNRVIVLDPGHGGIDPGAVSASGLKEKDVTLRIAQKTAELLISSGAAVVNLRPDDEDLAGDDRDLSVAERKRRDLQARVDIANDCQADCFISIHLNADPSPQWSGAQTFYRYGSAEGKKLAEAIQQELKRALGNTTREAISAGEYFVLEQTTMPAVIVEAGFISNPGEAKRLADETYQTQIAQAVWQGVMTYLALPPV